MHFVAVDGVVTVGTITTGTTVLDFPHAACAGAVMLLIPNRRNDRMAMVRRVERRSLVTWRDILDRALSANFFGEWKANCNLPPDDLER
mmetsp:Transcript_30338/g.54949  ORF Transcript_30338/g.54949 Transcript_30338/m.54949 type:complete len:89 (+) Transcript_30338:1122-1388(+)